MSTFVVEAVVGFFLIAFFLGQLGEERYGVWVLIGSVFQYRGILSLGLNSAVNRYIPVHLAQGDFAGVSRTVSTSFMYLLSMGIVLAVVCFFIYSNLEKWFVITPDLLNTAKLLVLVVGFLYCLSFPLQIFNATLSGLQRYDIINIIVLSFFVTRTILLVVLLKQGYGLLTMGLVFGATEVTGHLFKGFFVKKLLPQATITLRGFSWKFLKESTAYGTNTLLYTMGALILYKAGNILIGVFIDAASISRFSIAVAAIMLMASITQMFLKAVKPAVSDLDARGDSMRMQQVAFLTQKYTLLIIIPSCCFLVVMGREFLGVWVGAKIQDAAVLDMMATVMAIMAVAQAVSLSQYSNFVVLVGRGYHKVFGVLTLITAVIFITLALICLKVFNLGLIAVAWCNFIPLVLISGFILPFYFNRRMQITMPETIKSVWIPAVLGTLPTVILIAVWKFIAAPQSWLQIIGVAVAAGTLTLLSSWFLSLAPAEQKRFGRVINRK
jgi:O-antigen/teichoic acid export membrane protein